MNERIQKLLLEAQKSVQFLANSEESKQRIVMERFAELIIRTCIAKCDDLNSMKYIANHFGVEVKGLTHE